MAKSKSKHKGIEFKDMQPDHQYILEVLCADCGTLLNATHPMTGEAMRDKWDLLVISSPLSTPSCPKGCRATYSDCNANTDFLIRDAQLHVQPTGVGADTAPTAEPGDYHPFTDKVKGDQPRSGG